MEANSTTVNLKAEALKAGIIWGVIDIVLFLAVWYTAPNFMGSTWYSVMRLVVGVLLAIYFCKDLRTKAGGFWSFSQALMNIFIMFIVSAMLVFSFNMLFGKVIDKTYPVKMKEIITTASEKMLKDFGMTDDQLSEAMKATEERLESQFNPSFGEALMAFGIVAIMYFVGALIFAAIFKKPAPLYLEEEELSFPAKES